MPKRFTATEKWDDAWFWNLSATDKLFWLYVLDKCDYAGVWEANWSLAKIACGGVPDLKNFGNRMRKLSEDKFHVQKFLEFQYGVNFAKSNGSVRDSVISRLSRLGIDISSKVPSKNGHAN